MNNKALLLLTIGILFVSKITFADEGMWIPLLLEKYNIEEMKSKGFKLTAEDIYSINQASMKDAIVIFGRGCTGELISAQGLIMTNHQTVNVSKIPLTSLFCVQLQIPFVITYST